MENKLTDESTLNLKSAECGYKWYNGTNGDYIGIYYGVYIPCDIQIQEKDAAINVFQDKLEALKLVKKYKKARFKAFHFYHEAVDFAHNGAEQCNNAKDVSQTDSPSNVGEKPSPYRGPKPHDLIKLRKAIEAGNVEFVQNTIWENPRYLISVGDTPLVLQEGTRFNALHAAAKSKNEVMCKVILCTIADVNFIKLLYGEENYQDAEYRSKILLDLYLNTPDKALNETPLHIASKFGAIKVVEILVSFPQCDKTLRNKLGKLASEIICDRCEETRGISALKRKISLLLEETYYVPVLRSEDNCLPPVIGEPFSPTSPPSELNKNLLDAKVEIHAYAGPMEKAEAQKFRKIWKTPPRNKNLKSYENLRKLKYKDPQKGLECLGRVLASECDVGWKEYWPFLNAYVDITSKEGLDLFEEYLKHRFNMAYEIDSSTSCVSSSSSSDPMEKSNLGTEISPISDLCNAFQLCTLNDLNHTNIRSTIKIMPHVDTNNEKKVEMLPESPFAKNDLSPFLYVEKTCQVFANRILNDILHTMETEDSSPNTVLLETQMKQLMSVISSFKDDNRFNHVNFQAVHSRISSLIADKLLEVINEEQNYDQICQTLEKWLDVSGNNLDCFSSDDESINQRQLYSKLYKKTTSQNKQVVCLLQCLLTKLKNELEPVVSSANTEEECIKIWSKAKECSCILQSKFVKRNKRHENLINTFKGNARFNILENVSRKLTYSESNDSISADDGNSACKIFEYKIEESSSSDEEFYTPPSSPNFAELEDSDDDVFNDSKLPEIDVFIEGYSPTKMDYAAYTALQSKDCKLNPNEYPNIYKWFHMVSLYTDSEREQWVNYTNNTKCSIDSPKFSTPSEFYSQPSQILRLASVASPRSNDNRNLFNL